MDFLLIKEYFLISFVLTIIFSLIFDSLIGDPHFNYHPVNLIGKLLIFIKEKKRSTMPRGEKAYGIFLLIISIIIVWIPLFLIQILTWWIATSLNFTSFNSFPLVEIILYSAISGFILKWSFALKNLKDVSAPITDALSLEKLDDARFHLSYIVRRDTESLDKTHIISATVECISESSTDGITSVFWFYLAGNAIGVLVYHLINPFILWLFLGIPFAYMYRTINTADSIVGYKDPEYINLGWFSARMDDMANYIPARLTAIFMLLAGALYKKNVKNAVNVLKKERNALESLNAGWTMGAMAGLLEVQLEKVGKYKLGQSKKQLAIEDIRSSFKIIKITSLMFIISLTIISIIIIYLII